MNVSVLICTFGEKRWREFAINRALPTAKAQKEALEVHAWHGADLTLADVRNKAAEEALGDWLCFLDADDELAPGYLAAMREKHAQIERRDALLYPAAQYVNTDGTASPPRLLAQRRPLVEMNRAVIGTLVPKALFLEVGGFGDEPIYEDWALWLRCSKYVPLVPVEDAVYRVHQRTGSRNVDPTFARDWYDRIRAEHDVRPVA